MSRQYKIFGSIQNHEQQPIQLAGGNSNIAGPMMKKAELTNSNSSERTEINPFSGYSYTTGDNSLATS